MHKGRVIGVFLLFSAFILLTSCQLQFNRSTGNNVALRVVVPGDASGGGKSATGSKSLGGGTNVTVTITPQGTTGGSSQTLSTSVDGKNSIDFSFALSSSGSYKVTADMLDGSGNLLSTVSTQLAVPTGNYPVVLKIPSNLLSGALTDSTGYNYLIGTFSPTVYSYSIYPYIPPYTLTLTTVDPNATITSVTEKGNLVLPSSHGVYTFSDSSPFPIPVIIVVTAADGTATETYTVTLL